MIMAYTAEERALIWLAACSGLEERDCARLLQEAKNPLSLFEETEKFLPRVIKEAPKRLYNSNRAKREAQLNDFLRELDDKGYFAVTLRSADYPARLKCIPDAPPVLYGKGRRELLKEQAFCIVGSRVTPPWAAEQAKKIAGELARQFVIVTGFAEGGDRAAIDGALPSGNLICVLPHGLDGCYPAAHASLKKRVAEAGLLLSEYLPEEQVRKFSFHERNRILAGMGAGVLVVSAGERSGTAITARYASEFSREVFAFPYNVGSRQGVGCNELIKKGASLVTDAQDILSVYGFEKQEESSVLLSDEENRCLAALRDAGELHVSQIAERAGMQIFEAAAVMSSLEMKGLAVKAGGNRYTAL